MANKDQIEMRAPGPSMFRTDSETWSAFPARKVRGEQELMGERVVGKGHEV